MFVVVIRFTFFTTLRIKYLILSEFSSLCKELSAYGDASLSLTSLATTEEVASVVEQPLESYI